MPSSMKMPGCKMRGEGSCCDQHAALALWDSHGVGIQTEMSRKKAFVHIDFSFNWKGQNLSAPYIVAVPMLFLIAYI